MALSAAGGVCMCPWWQNTSKTQFHLTSSLSLSSNCPLANSWECARRCTKRNSQGPGGGRIKRAKLVHFSRVGDNTGLKLSHFHVPSLTAQSDAQYFNCSSSDTNTLRCLQWEQRYNNRPKLCLSLFGSDVRAGIKMWWPLANFPSFGLRHMLCGSSLQQSPLQLHDSSNCSWNTDQNWARGRFFRVAKLSSEGYTWKPTPLEK